MNVLREFIHDIIIEYSDNACRYESSIIKSLKLAGAAGYMKRAACSDASRPDADIKVGGEVFYVEVKSNSHAQMGGGSVGYSVADKHFYPVGQNRDLSETIADLLNNMNDTSLHKGLRTLLQHLSRTANKTFTEIPMYGFSSQAWEDAKEFGLLQAINRTFESSVDVIRDHYANKDTFYIQIGGRGFFRLGDANPAGLRVPVLQGRVKLEVRVVKSKGDETTPGAASMRVQARLLANNSSPYTLDDPASVEQMLKKKEPKA